MSLQPGCPRCATAFPEPSPTERTCPEHGAGPVLWRCQESSYDDFTEVLDLASGWPLYLPWPMSPGWTVSDFAVVCAPPDGRTTRGGRPRATLTCCSGTSALDGPVDVLVVSEDAGVGLGARCAGTTGLDPGPELGGTSPAVRVRIGSQAVPLWPVSTSTSDGDLDRSAFAGESGGRWLSVILRPASAMLLLRDDWILRDAACLGPGLVEVLFGGPRPPW